LYICCWSLFRNCSASASGADLCSPEAQVKFTVAMQMRLYAPPQQVRFEI
jgi:hypothetical protein